MEARLKLLVANVRYDNRQDNELLDLIERTDPDLGLTVEPTAWWAKHLQPLEQDYPHVIEHPQQNHYGIILYSRLELIDPEV